MNSHLSDLWVWRNVNDAFTSIASQYTMRTVVMLKEDEIVSSEYDYNRIRIWYNPETRQVTSVTEG